MALMSGIAGCVPAVVGTVSLSRAIVPDLLQGGVALPESVKRRWCAAASAKVSARRCACGMVRRRASAEDLANLTLAVGPGQADHARLRDRFLAAWHRAIVLFLRGNSVRTGQNQCGSGNNPTRGVGDTQAILLANHNIGSMPTSRSSGGN